MHWFRRQTVSRRLRTPALVVLVGIWLPIVSACTHLSPYHRRDQSAQVESVPNTAIDHRLLLVGDAGAPDPKGEPTLQLLAHVVSMLPERTTVVFLGDNAYERGMPPPLEPGEATLDKVADAADAVLPQVFDSRGEAERNVNAQIDVVRGNHARAIFIPGNHDWDQFEIGGWERILNLGTYLRDAAAEGGANVSLLPEGGCPGPVPVRLGSRAALLALDTQWWLETRQDGKPTATNNPTHCPYTVETDVRDAIVSELEAAKKENRWAVVAGHHPLASNGPHGGFVDIATSLFPFRVLSNYVPFFIEFIPLPGLGSIVVGLRQCCSPSAQDMSNGRNRHMRNAILYSMIEAEKKHAAPLLYAAGHDHSLQLFESKKGPRFTLVSGLGSSARASAVSSGRSTLFAHSNSAQPGFMQIDFLKDGAVRLAVIERTVERPDGFEAYSAFLAKPR